MLSSVGLYVLPEVLHENKALQHFFIEKKV